MTSLFILLGVLLSSLTVYAEVIVPDFFDEQLLPGKWYEIAYASTNHELVSYRLTYSLDFYIYKLNLNNNPLITYKGLKGPGVKCYDITMMGRIGSQIGNYIFDHENLYRHFYTFTVLNDRHTFLHINMVRGRFIGIVSMLLARTQNVREVIKRKWREVSRGYGIKDRNVIFFPRNTGECKYL